MAKDSVFAEEINVIEKQCSALDYAISKLFTYICAHTHVTKIIKDQQAIILKDGDWRSSKKCGLEELNGKMI